METLAYKIVVFESFEIAVVGIFGSLKKEVQGSAEFIEALTKLTGQTISKIIVDCQELKEIDSWHIGFLLKVADGFEFSSKGKLFIARLPESVYLIFQMLGIFSFLPHSPNLMEAFYFIEQAYSINFSPEKKINNVKIHSPEKLLQRLNEIERNGGAEGEVLNLLSFFSADLAFTKEVFPYWMKLLSSEEYRIFISSLSFLWQMSTLKSRELFVLLKDQLVVEKNRERRRELVSFLGNIATPVAIDALLLALKDEDIWEVAAFRLKLRMHFISDSDEKRKVFAFVEVLPDTMKSRTFTILRSTTYRPFF